MHINLTLGVEALVARLAGRTAFFPVTGDLVGLTLDRCIHDMVPADGTVVEADEPLPESDSMLLIVLSVPSLT